jgi:hypothetical protein
VDRSAIQRWFAERTTTLIFRATLSRTACGQFPPRHGTIFHLGSTTICRLLLAYWPEFHEGSCCAIAIRYEDWQYIGGGNVYLIFFAGANIDDPPNQWNVVGKTTYPQGAVF